MGGVENRVSCSGYLTPEIGSATKQRHLLLSSGGLPYTYVVYLYIIYWMYVDQIMFRNIELEIWNVNDELLRNIGRLILIERICWFGNSHLLFQYPLDDVF